MKGGRVQSTRTVGSTATRPSHHINVLHAVFLALWHFLPRLQGFHVIRLLGQIIRTDSMVAAVYVVEQICHGFRWAEVNLFASMESCFSLSCPVFLLKGHDPPLGWDAPGIAFPPFSLLPSVIHQVQTEEARLVLVAPHALSDPAPPV